MINPGQYIKVVFKNGTQLEGLVESWTDKQSVLKSIDDTSLMIIFNTLEDILAVKIILNFSSPAEAPKRRTALETEFEEVRKSPSTDDLRILKLAELRKRLNKEEQEIIKQRFNEHQPSQVGNTSYGIPNLNTKHGPK